MDSGRLWYLNLDAERELQRPLGYRPDARTLSWVAQHAPAVAAVLAEPHDVVLDAATLECGFEVRRIQPTLRAEGIAWMPTPHAQHMLRRAGAIPAPAPDLSVLQRCNRKDFRLFADVGLKEACFETEPGPLLAWLKAKGDQRWVGKRAFSFAGRGLRVLPQALAADDTRWLEHGCRAGGILLEPWVNIVAEFSLHGHLAADGKCDWGAPCRQWVDGFRAPTRVVADATSLTVCELDSLRAAAEALSSTLHSVGYFGPFGVDAFRYRSNSGGLLFNPASELNARYTVGYARGMSARQLARAPERHA